MLRARSARPLCAGSIGVILCGSGYGEGTEHGYGEGTERGHGEGTEHRHGEGTERGHGEGVQCAMETGAERATVGWALLRRAEDEPQGHSGALARRREKQAWARTATSLLEWAVVALRGAQRHIRQSGLIRGEEDGDGGGRGWWWGWGGGGRGLVVGGGEAEVGREGAGGKETSRGQWRGNTLWAS
eukprot:44262-Chlamydomonas_euryale.AAC.7